MRILHVVSRSQRRGAERVALDLAEELRALGHDNQIVALVQGLDGGQDPALRPLVATRSLLPHTRALAAWRLGRLLEREPVDVVLAHGGTPAQVTIAGHPRSRPPVVWQQILGFPDKVHKQPRRALWWLVARQVGGAVALTQADAEELRWVGVKGKLSVIPNFRRPQRFHEIDRPTAGVDLRREIGVAPDTLLIGFVGYLVDQKRPERALEVLARVRERGIAAHLVVAGDGPLRSMLEGEVRAQGLERHVTLLGHRDDVESVFGGVDVALLTSDDEGIPGVAIEAAMSGCPFVTFDVGGVDEVVIDGLTGIVIERQDTVAMADAVASLLRDDERRRGLGEQARHRSSEFAAPEQAKTYADFLHECHAATSTEDESVTSEEKRVKVCVFLPSLSGGGAESSMLRIATELADRGHSVDLLTARAELAANNRPDTKVHYRTFSKRHARSAILGLALHLRRSRPDVLLTAMDHANVSGLLAARLSGVRLPVVISFHSDITAASRGTRGVIARLRPTLARWSINQAALVIGVSEGVRASLEQIAGTSPTPIVTIYNPTVRDSIFELAAEPVTEVRADELAHTVLAVGRLSPEKGYDVMLAAFARVATDDPRLRLEILGEGALRNELEQLACELGIADRVRFPGYVENPYKYMARCRVFAFASRWEGLPTVLVEAGVLGCTIVSTDCPSGPRELLTGRAQATLVPVDDTDGFAAALRDALQRDRYGTQGGWHQHTMVESGRRYEERLIGVVAGNSPARPKSRRSTVHQAST